MAKTKIELPRVSGWFEDRTAGERVDEVLSILTTELKYLKAADTTSVGGTPASQVGSSGLFYQTFESDVSTWTKRTDSGTITYPPNGKAGGRAFRSDGGETFYEFPGKIPFDPDRLYRIRTRVRMVTEPALAGESGIYVGVQAYTADGATLLDRDGGADATKPHWVATAESDMNSRVEGTWYTFTGYFSGEGAGEATPSTDADSPRALESGVRYMSPCFILNSVSGTGVAEIDFISIDVLTEGDESNQVLKDVVDRSSGYVANDRVRTASIETGAVTADRANFGTLAAAEANLGDVVAGTISGLFLEVDTDATGSDLIIGAGSAGGFTSPYAFMVTADGDITGTDIFLENALELEGFVNASRTLKGKVLGSDQNNSGTGGGVRLTDAGGTSIADFHSTQGTSITGAMTVSGTLTVAALAGAYTVPFSKITGTVTASGFSGSSFTFNGATDSFTIEDMGTVGATEEIWIEITHDGGTAYLHGLASK